MNTKHWICKDGTHIRIKDMTDSHLANTIAYLERMAERVKLEVPFPNFSGDMAQYYAERDYDILQESTVEDIYPIYQDLCEERDRRERVAHHQ